MRKKQLTMLTLVLALMSLNLADVRAAQCTATLYASKEMMVAGSVEITIDGGVTVTFTTSGGWLLTETHLYVGSSPPDKHSPGQFPYKHENLGGVTSDSYTVPLPSSSPLLYIAAHAVVKKPTGCGCWQEETAWAGDCSCCGCPTCDTIAFDKGWGWYLEIDW